LVRIAQQAILESSELGVRAGLDDALSDDGRGRMAGVEKSRIARWACLFVFLDSARFEHASVNKKEQFRGDTLWSFLFFGLEKPGLAFAEILLLWLSIAATIAAFRKWSGAAALLLAPYLAWVSFAAFLNFTIWQLNA
jgi:TspO/MBR family